MDNKVNLLPKEVKALIDTMTPQKVSTPITTQDIRKYCKATGAQKTTTGKATVTLPPGTTQHQETPHD